MNKLHDQLLEIDGPGMDIAGLWHLDCPGITLKYCTDKIHENQKIIWNIHRQHDTEDYRWVKFDQIIIEGVIRIELKFSEDWLGEKLFFTWRGRDTVDSEIQFDDERNSGYVIFSSMHECWGVISALGEGWTFTGKKVDKMLPSKSQNALNKEYLNYERCFLGKGI
jgi:hypothetical protein